MKFATVASGATALALAFACHLSASPISGTFDIVGNVTATANSISWTGPNAPFPPETAVVSSANGSFAAAAGTDVTIKDLNNTQEPVGSFSPQPFITFSVAGLPSLLINTVYPGLYSSAGCFATPPAVGQTCTPGPPITTASPFSFQNTQPPPPDGPQSTASWVFSGVTADNSATWRGVFTSQFPVPFQSVLAAFGPGGSGSVTNSYSATFTVSGTSTVPEPESLFLMLGGLVLVSGSYLKKKLL
ncbi:MAG TPA: PEP-CTERM sorting domain-containing protein [Bryobacteraceae bacterium]|nr:PEP-CTERM sorting domain-containing protein [Bryobacteraceae bacterium]